MLLNIILIILLVILGDKTREKLVAVMEKEIEEHDKRMKILKEKYEN